MSSKIHHFDLSDHKKKKMCKHLLRNYSMMELNDSFVYETNGAKVTYSDHYLAVKAMFAACKDQIRSVPQYKYY